MKDQNWRPADETVQATLLGVLKLCGLTFAVVVGTALGNGVPMARSVSAGFESGFKTGLSKCPCANKRPSTATVATLKPEADPQPRAASPTPITVTTSVDNPASVVLSLETSKKGGANEPQSRIK